MKIVPFPAITLNLTAAALLATSVAALAEMQPGIDTSTDGSPSAVS